MMLEFNFRMLTLAREVRGLTQLELSKDTQTDQGYLSKVEKGIIKKPTDELVEKYAKALNFPVIFFYQQENKTLIGDFFYRKRNSMLVKEKTKIEAEIDLLRWIYNKLLKSIEIPEPRFPSVVISKNFSPTDAAVLARQFYNVPKGAIVNLISIVEKNGIAIILLDTTNMKFDGMTVYTDSNHPIIFLNKNMPNDRKRHTIAHELGHQIMHMPHIYNFELYDRLKQDSNALEKEADMFAAEFLMPEKEITPELKNIRYSDLSQLKSYWHVSKKSLMYRANFLKQIDADRYKNLLIDLSRHGERIKEDFDVFLEDPKLIKQIFEAYSQVLKYDSEQLAEYLSISQSDINKIKRDNISSKLRIAL